MQWPRWSEIVLGIVAIAAAVLVGVAAGRAGSGTGIGRLRVAASGQAAIAPNEAQVTLGANVTAATAAQALSRLSAIAHRMVAAVGRYAIAAKDVQTSNLSVGQNYGPNGQLQGYQASESFTLRVFRLSVLGSVVSAATTAGANQVNGISFTDSDPNAGMAAAVSQALASARRQALAEARQLKVTLGPVVSVQISQNQSGPPIIYANMRASSAVPDVPVAPGSQMVSAQATVVYAFR